MGFDENDLMGARTEGALTVALPLVSGLMEMGAAIGDDDLGNAAHALLVVMADRLGIPSDALDAAMAAGAEMARREGPF